MTITIPDELAPRLETLARLAGLKSPSEYVVQIVRQSSEGQAQEQTPAGASTAVPEQLKKRESAYDVAERLGLVGCIKDGPPELSTNPKYMEGFGE